MYSISTRLPVNNHPSFVFYLNFYFSKYDLIWQQTTLLWQALPVNLVLRHMLWQALLVNLVLRYTVWQALPVNLVLRYTVWQALPVNLVLRYTAVVCHYSSTHCNLYYFYTYYIFHVPATTYLLLAMSKTIIFLVNKCDKRETLGKRDRCWFGFEDI